MEETVTTEEESVPCDAKVRPVIENVTAEFVPFETLVTINARNDINYIPPIIDNDLLEDDASEVDEVYREQNYADEDEEEHYVTMIQDSVASIFTEEIPEVPCETRKRCMLLRTLCRDVKKTWSCITDDM